MSMPTIEAAPDCLSADARLPHRRGSYLPLLGIVVIAFILRLFCVVFLTGTIDTEGAEYARIAENLVSGSGYRGIATPGKELMFPPLFPFLIAATSALTRNVELAGRLVSVWMGTLLVLPIYFIGRHLYNRKAAYLAAALIACHPLLVNFSATVYCETTYLTLLLTAVYWSFRALRLRTARTFILAGGSFGLTYLTRPEAVIYLVFALALTLVYVSRTCRQDLSKAALRAIWLPLAFLVFAAPYILWLHAETGQWRLEGKSPLNYTTAWETLQGRDPYDAQYGVDSDLTERGVWIQANLSTIRSARFQPRDVARYCFAKSKAILDYSKDYLANGTIFGSPMLFAFAVLGLFRRPWHREAAANHLFLLMLLFVATVALFGIYYLSIRFLLVFLPVLILWASNGILELARWGQSSFRLAFRGRSKFRWAEPAAAGLIGALIPLGALTAVGNVYELRAFNGNSRTVQDAAEWLDAYAPGPKTVMDTSTIVAFHAAATFVPFPYCNSDVALRYADKRKVDFVILRDGDLRSRPYLEDWMESGIPSGRANLIYSTRSPALGRIRIYRWNPPGATATPAPPRLNSVTD